MRRLGLLALALSVCLLAVNVAQADFWAWNGSTSDWTVASNWSDYNIATSTWISPATAIPASTDDVYFNGYFGGYNQGTGTIALPNGTTTIDDAYFGDGWTQFNFSNAAATLDVTGNFNFESNATSNAAPFNPSTIASVLNVSGLFAPQLSSYGSQLSVTSNGNTFGGGFNVLGQVTTIAGNNNVINGGITVEGTCFDNYQGNVYGSLNGVLEFSGTGNTFGAIPITLNAFGVLDLASAQDLSAVTAINFNGGMLELAAGNTFSAMTGGFNVVSGTLTVNGGDACLGSPTLNNIQLGGAYSFGMLAGYTDFPGTSDYSPISASRTITLNGEGGWIWWHCYQFEPGAYDFTDIESAIVGTGALFQKGNSWTRLMNNGLGAAADTYSGGTVVLGNMYVDTMRALGTGNVLVAPGADLQLTAGANVAAAAKILIAGAPSGNMDFSGVLDLCGDTWGWASPSPTPGFIPMIDPASTGILRLNYANNVGDGTPLATALETGIAGDGTNGYLWIGANSWSGYYGSTLAPGEPVTPGGNPTYRFSSAGVAAEENLYIGNGVLVGNTDVWVNAGGINLGAANTFTGTLTIQNTINLNGDFAWGEYGGAGITGTEVGVWGTAQTTAGASPLGSATGNVVMSSGFLGIAGSNGGVAMAKNGLSFSGMDILEIVGDYWNGSAYQPAQTTLSLTTLTRVDNGTLVIAPGSGFGLGVGGTEHLQAANAATMVDSNGVVAPYIVAANGFGTGDFLTYDATAGFTTYASYVAMPAGGGAGTEVVNTSGATLSGNTNIWNLKISGGSINGGGTLTLNGGGLIITNDSTFNTNIQAGGSGTNELVVYNNCNEGPGGSATTFNGTITAGGLTLFGPGNIRMTADNTSTLVGNITVNSGTIEYSNDNQFGAAANNIILNGGTLWTSYGYNAPIYHNIEIGPAGGYIEDSYNGGADVESVISDLDPAHPGVVYFFGNTNYIGVAATNTGGTDFGWGSTWLINNGQPGPGPVVIEAGGHMSVYRTTVPDMSASAVTILSNGAGMGTLNLAIAGAMIGSLAGSGNVIFGDPYSPQYDMTLYVGYNNQSTDFYGNIESLDCRNGGLYKVGTGTLTLWGNVSIPNTTDPNNPNVGYTTINGGTLVINGLYSAGSRGAAPINIDSGGTLTGQGTVDAPIYVYAGGNLTGSLMIGGSVTVSGTNNTGGPAGAANLANSTITGSVGLNMGGTFTGVNTTINGLTSTTNAYDTFTGANCTINNLAAGFRGGTITGTNTINGSDVTLGFKNNANGTGIATLSGSNTLNAVSTYVLMENAIITGSNIINTGALYLNYTYTYGATVSGSNTINGPTYMDWSSNLGIANAVVTGSNTFNGAVTIYGGSFLGNNTITTGGLTTAAGSNAIVSPHVGATAGTLAIVGDVALDHTTTLNYDLGTPGTIGGGINDLIDVTGNLSLDGTLNVTGLTGFSTGTYTLFTYTGALTEPSGPLTLGTMPGGMGYTYTISTATAGQVNLDVVLPYAPGDTNHDGVLNSLDIDAIYHNFGAPATSQWKVDGDGNVVGQGDVTYELHTYFHTNYGDANLDTKTDFSDFQILLDHWQVSGPTVGWAQGDFNGSYSVDFLDFQTLLDYWNPGGWSFGQQAPAQTPEPASLTLLLLGGLALLRRSRKA